MPSAFPTCKIDDHVAAENGGLAKGMGYIDVQCCMVCVDKRKCDGGGTAIQNVDGSEKENT